MNIWPPAWAAFLWENGMTPGQDAIDLVKQSEGLRLHAYPDPGSHGAPYTIGYGHARGVKLGQTIAEAQADAFLAADLAEAGQAVSRLVTVPLTQSMFDALCDFVFNLGGGSLQRSTLLRQLNARNYQGAANQFKSWCMAGGKVLPGLVKRRAAEKQLFLKDGIPG